MKKTPLTKKSIHLTERQFTLASLSFFFFLTWLWATWWMGDLFCIGREHSFFSTDAVLMYGLWQQRFGSLWILGRAVLTLYRWPLLGGLLTAVLLTLGSWLCGYCLRLRLRWRWLQFLPAAAWLIWVAWLGLNFYYQSEPGRPFGVLLLFDVVCAIDAFIIWTFKGHRKKRLVSREAAPLSSSVKRPDGSSASTKGDTAPVAFASKGTIFITLLCLVACFAIPVLITQVRHPYVRPLSRMQVQMLSSDWNGMVTTARSHATLSYRPLAAFYAIALVHTGHLTDALFDIRLDYDSLYVVNRSGTGDSGSGLYEIDGNYAAGLFRATTHKAMEHLTMQGPTLYSLKYLARTALLDYDWQLARKYLTIIFRMPFEGDFVRRYQPMVGHADLVEADAEFALLRRTEPVEDSFESAYQAPVFLGYPAVLTSGRSMDALQQSLMANLYSKRMPDFLFRAQMLAGTIPPKTIAEGLVTQLLKNPSIGQAFPALQMNAQVFQGFLRSVTPYMKDRPAYARKLFDQYAGYYPYYYYFGNLKATRKSDDKEHASSRAGVN